MLLPMIRPMLRPMFRPIFRPIPRHTLLSLLTALPIFLAGCDGRKPVDADGNLIRPPILELSADKEAVGVGKDTTMAVRALLVNALHGTMAQRELHFTASVGFITSPATTNDSGVAQGVYYTRNRNLTAPAQDTLTVSFTYDGPDGSETVTDTLILRLIPGAPAADDVVGSIELSTSRTAVQVKGSGNTDQAVISARVFDINHARIKDGTRVGFRLLSGPGGGESLGNGITDTASTKDGVATVTFHGGTSIGVVEIQATSGSESIRQALLTVTSGPPEHINITVRKDSLQTAGNRWRMQIQASLTDAYLNPVKDSIGVLFTLEPGAIDPSAISVQGSAYTGNLRCKDTTEADCRAVPGSAFSYVTYRSEVVFDTLKLAAETSTGSRSIRSVLAFRAPLQNAAVKADYFGGAVFAPSDMPMDTLVIQGALQDGFGYGVPRAKLCIFTDGGVPLDTCLATDAEGKAAFRMTVTSRDQTSLNPFRVINVRLVEQSTGAEGATSFMAIFQ
jgi:hypothetical protein